MLQTYVQTLNGAALPKDMVYDFHVFERDGILFAYVEGERHNRVSENFEEMWDFWSRVAAEMKQRGLRRLLAVISARGTLRSLDVRTFYRRLGEMGFMADMRLAVVVDLPDFERPVLQLGVSAAAQDGWTICLCASEREAKAWLQRVD